MGDNVEKKDILDLSIEEQMKLNAKNLMKLSLEKRREILTESAKLVEDEYSEDGELRKFGAIDSIIEY